MRTVWRLLLLLAALIVIVFAVSNRAEVSLGLWPLPAAVQAPVYLVVIGGLVFGFILGELAAWVAGRQWRRSNANWPRPSRRVRRNRRPSAPRRPEAAGEQSWTFPVRS